MFLNNVFNVAGEKAHTAQIFQSRYLAMISMQPILGRAGMQALLIFKPILLRNDVVCSTCH
ncbi:hypothetical protein EDF70_1267 [Neorhizobium sp. JUb45]|nr:hypothetical protein EDF70_1267 [Neorhizobium sp. JUb45]